ncbi:MAG TPA: hypothetical protein VF188_15735 [Longimicrobiales bacterium]
MGRCYAGRGWSVRRRRWSVACGVALSAVLIAAHPGLARQAAVQPDSRETAVDRERARDDRATFSRLVLPATLGSAAGTVAGALVGEQLGWGGGDDPGLISAAIFGVLGGALGSATGVWLAGPGGDDLTVGTSWAAGGVGVLGGVAGALALGFATDGDGILIGFVVGQGTVTAAVASAIAN